MQQAPQRRSVERNYEMQKLRRGHDSEKPAKIDCGRPGNGAFRGCRFSFCVVLGARDHSIADRRLSVGVGNSWAWLLVPKLQEVQFVLK
jgi:hypothetical protein